MSLEKLNKEKFNKIFGRHYNNILYYAVSYIYDKEVAESIVQDVFTIVWKNIEDLEENILPYLVVLTKRKCMNHLRKERNKQNFINDQKNSYSSNISYDSLKNSGIEYLLHNEVQEILYKTLNNMPEKTKEAFCLNRFGNKTYLEIAKQQGVTVKNIEYRIMSALNLLKQNLAEFLVIFIFCVISDVI